MLLLIGDFSSELRGIPREKVSVGLDTTLQGELGIDSIARTELAVRLEQELGVIVGSDAVLSANTARELIREIRSVSPSELSARDEPSDFFPERQSEPPVEAKTLPEVLSFYASAYGELNQLVLLGESAPVPLSFAELYRQAQSVRTGLVERGLRRGERVALMLPTGEDFFAAFFGILLAGGVPVPLYPPARISRLEEHLRRQVGILKNSDARLLITIPEMRLLSTLLKMRLNSLDAVLTVSEVKLEPEGEDVLVKGEDIALIQYTSGSTGEPKGVVLTHNNLLANIRAMGEGIGATSRDVFVSWLPLYHDMGLIGAWLGTLYYGARLVIMSPLVFLARPQAWLEAITRYRGTLSAAPNFAYELCASKLADEQLVGLDLSSWRIAFNGAENVSPETIERFTTRFAAFGFKQTTMLPVYGLAENGVGLSFPPTSRVPRVDSVDRNLLEEQGIARPASPDVPATIQFVSTGRAIPRHEIRIVDREGRLRGEREQGLIQFRGPSATSGYFRNEQATRNLFDGEWLSTGDFGYFAAGELYLTGRAKELIIRGGRNIHPVEIEKPVEALPNVRKGCVIAFGVRNDAMGTERLVVALESRLEEPSAKAQLAAEVRDTVGRAVDLVPDDVCILAPRSIPKTSSGKLRRVECRIMYERGRLGATPAPWRKLLSFAAKSFGYRTGRAFLRLLEIVVALYCGVVFIVLVPFVWWAVMLFPTIALRRAWAHRFSKLFFLLVGTPLRVTGREAIPSSGQLVVVSKHSSYLDSLILTAVLPPRFAFVAKRELQYNFFLRLPLERLGTLFVERNIPEQALADAERLSEKVKAGESVIFFPEGTFSLSPAVLPFHMGAFVLAAEQGIPLIPVSLRGSREALVPGSWFPRWSRIHVQFGELLIPEENNWRGALKLKAKSREFIVRTCGEPDLGE